MHYYNAYRLLTVSRHRSSPMLSHLPPRAVIPKRRWWDLNPHPQSWETELFSLKLQRQEGRSPYGRKEILTLRSLRSSVRGLTVKFSVTNLVARAALAVLGSLCGSIRSAKFREIVAGHTAALGSAVFVLSTLSGAGRISCHGKSPTSQPKYRPKNRVTFCQ